MMKSIPGEKGPGKKAENIAINDELVLDKGRFIVYHMELC